MSARRKLNQGYIQGSFLLAGIIGAACESWTVFWIAAVILISLSFHSGEIRPSSRQRSDKSRPRGRDRPRDGRFP